jgi:hypothetical protein
MKREVYETDYISLATWRRWLYEPQSTLYRVPIMSSTRFCIGKLAKAFIKVAQGLFLESFIIHLASLAC